MFSFFHKKSSKKNQKPVKSTNDLCEATTNLNNINKTSKSKTNDSLVAKVHNNINNNNNNNHRLSNGSVISPFGYFTTGRFLDKKRTSQLPIGIKYHFNIF